MQHEIILGGHVFYLASFTAQMLDTTGYIPVSDQTDSSIHASSNINFTVQLSK